MLDNVITVTDPALFSYQKGGCSWVKGENLPIILLFSEVTQ